MFFKKKKQQPKISEHYTYSYEPVADQSQPQSTVKSSSMHESQSTTKGIISTIALLVAAPLFALFLTAHVFQPYEVDGFSMETTLQDGDRLVVYKLPKTLSNIGLQDISYDRGDIIVFDRPPQLNSGNSTRHLIKRVIGLPGERVVVKNGSVIVHNVDNPNGFNPDEGQPYNDSIVSTPGNVDITVGQDELFVLGDNRSNSSDSRFFGVVTDDLLVGRATARFIPVGNMQRL